jgi:hypothetical protein
MDKIGFRFFYFLFIFNLGVNGSSARSTMVVAIHLATHSLPQVWHPFFLVLGLNKNSLVPYGLLILLAPFQHPFLIRGAGSIHPQNNDSLNQLAPVGTSIMWCWEDNSL